MIIEKVFAIEAEPGVIWDALWAELSQGDASLFKVEHSHRPSSLAIDLKLGGMPSRITYSLVRQDALTHVSASIEPLSGRYGLMQLLTLGRMKTHYELILSQALSNLKQAIEGATPRG